MKIQFQSLRMRQARLERIERANEIIADYQADGLMLTLRQLYYQFVARGLIENTLREYKNLGQAINDGRMAGLVDWSAIEDRTRDTVVPPHWSGPGEIIRSAANSYARDKWEGQDVAPEVWIEKEALAGVLENACYDLDVPFFACRGYVSASAMFEASRRLVRYRRDGRRPLIIHLGDHDPSGLDMTRDIENRLSVMCGESIDVDRIALNRDQIDQYDPPPNHTKLSDSRAGGYKWKHSWELDALPPNVLRSIVEGAVTAVRIDSRFNKIKKQEEAEREELHAFATQWGDR